jgi:hypothetical protein
MKKQKIETSTDDKRFDIRNIPLKDWNRIRGLAKIYAGGNVSLWLRHGGINAPRKHLVKDEKKQARV